MNSQLHFQIDPHSGVPVYRQLMDQIKYYAASGTLAPGDQLPSIRELAQSLTVNPTTIVKAYNELVHEGIIELRHGKGAFLALHVHTLSSTERDKALRRIARQLAVEAGQMGASPSGVIQIVEEELAAVLREHLQQELPAKLRVVGSKS
jgi:GntR family transcriptional regulator